MKVEIKTLPDIDVVFVMKTGPYGESAPAAWQALGEKLGEHGLNNAVRKVIGYGLDHPATIPAHMLRYVACFSLQEDCSPEKLAHFERQTLSGGRYGVLTMKGDYSKMPENFGKLVNEWLPSSREVPDFTRPFLEIYLNSPDEVGMENVLTELHLPIREQIEAN